MTQKTLKVGIISGNFGMYAHKPGWEACPGVEVAAVCTSREETARVAAAQNGIAKAYWNHVDMARDPDLDIIVVGTKPNLRRDMVLEAIRNGKHVFAMAPLAANLTDARDMRDAARAAGVVAGIDSVLPWHGANRFIRDELVSGRAGKPISVEARFVINLFNGNPHGDYWQWFGVRSTGASVYRNLGTHTLHLLVYLLGEVEAVAALTTIALKEWHFQDGTMMRPQVADTAQILLRFANGTMGTVTLGWCAAPISGWRMELSAANVSYRTEDTGYFPTNRDLKLFRGDRTQGFTPIAVPPAYPSIPTEQFQSELGAAQAWDITQAAQDFVRAVRTGGAPLPDFETGYHVEAVVEAISRAAETRSWVDVASVAAGF